jgi:hypothetical protein
MIITLPPEIEAALTELARRQGVSPEVLALSALRERFARSALLEPQDEWERRLFAVSSDCGTAIPHSALRREELYD